MAKEKEDDTTSNTVGVCVALGISFGAAFGVSFGPLVFDDLSMGIALGVSFGTVIGVTIGTLLEARKKAEQRDSTSESRVSCCGISETYEAFRKVSNFFRPDGEKTTTRLSGMRFAHFRL